MYQNKISNCIALTVFQKVNFSQTGLNLNKTPIVGAHWAADCVMQRLNILGSIEYNYTFFQIKFIAAPNWWTGIYICNIYEVYSSTDPINSAQYVSRAEY